MFSVYYNHWEYWSLYHKITFDGVNNLILINPAVVTLDVQRDIYSAWKQWMLLKDIENFRYTTPFSVIGGEPLSGGESLDATFFLINGWRIKPATGTYTLNIIGNIFEVDGGEIKVDADVVENRPNNIAINTQTSTIVRRITSDSAVTASLVGSQATQLTTIETTTTNTYNEVVTQTGTLSTIDTTTSASYNQLLSQSSDLVEISGSTSANYDLLLSNSSSIQDIDIIVTELQSKLDELWQVHGLKIGFPVNVTQNEREVIGSNISQSFVTVDTGSLQQTTVTRV
jgi:hypothetical protein